MNRIRIIVLSLAILFFPRIDAFSFDPPKAGGEKPVKNIILMIGDGMGTAQVHAGLTANGGKLNLERFPIAGFLKTHSTSFVTDSGAGGTAIATGHKTYNGAIGVDAQGQPVKTILEWAEEAGKATGMATTCAITHATPASFISHQKKRSDYELIAADFLKTDIDVFIGGGYDHFAKRKDGVNLTEELRKKGYQVALTIDEVRETSSGPVAGLLYPVHPPKWSEGRGNLLAESVTEAIRLLSADPDGFFLMVEGSQIDWAGHDNQAQHVADEMIDFDRAVGVALDFAINNGQTLVIVTADHETGGVTLLDGDYETGSLKASFSTTDHTGVMVPVFTYGPHALKFGGIHDNTEVFTKMMESFGFKSK
ncbi:MAG: alkaline phosphatase [Bacteroidales bacterium]